MEKAVPVEEDAEVEAAVGDMEATDVWMGGDCRQVGANGCVGDGTLECGAHCLLLRRDWPSGGQKTHAAQLRSTG